MLVHVCQCILLLSTREMMNEHNSSILQLLERVKNTLMCLDATYVHTQQAFSLPLRIEHSTLSLVDRNQSVDVVSFLIGVFLCKNQCWEEACRSVEGISTGSIKCIAHFLSGLYISFFSLGSAWNIQVTDLSVDTCIWIFHLISESYPKII